MAFDVYAKIIFVKSINNEEPCIFNKKILYLRAVEVNKFVKFNCKNQQII